MDYQNILLITTAILTVGLSLFIVRGEKKDTNSIFALFILAIGLWSFGLAFFRFVSDLSVAHQYARMYYIAAAAIPIFFLHFSFIFPQKNLFGIRRQLLVYSIPVILALIILAFPGAIIKKVFIDIRGIKDVVINPVGYTLYTIYFIGYLIVAYYNLFVSYRITSQNVVKSQLRFLFIGTIGPYLLAMYFNLFLPPFNYGYIWVGPLFATVVIWSVMYAVYRYKLFDVKVITTEIFTFTLWVFIFVRTLLVEGFQEKVINAGFLLFTIVFGILLIRSVIKEVRQREQIEKLSEEKSEFMSFASHQVKGPLTNVRVGTSELLAGTFGPISDQVRDIIKGLYNAADKAIPMVQNFLDVSKLEQTGGVMQFEKKPFDFRTVVEEVVKEQRLTSAGRSLTIDFAVEGEGNFTVNADASKMKDVVFNLVDNAVKYTPRGSVQVKLQADSANKKILLSVKDSGVGLAKDDLSKLFTKFGRGKDAKKVNLHSSGLGLYLAKQIIDAHDGKIWAESEGSGRGSTFFVELPRA